MRRFAEDTTVPIHKSREEIDRLLTDWGAGGMMWADDKERFRVELQFRWMHKPTGQVYIARFSMQLKTNEELRKAAHVSYRFSQQRFDKLVEGRGRAEHRRMLIWLKAAFNAIADGMLTPEQVFFAWLVTSDGSTAYAHAYNSPTLLGVVLPPPPELKSLPAKGGTA